MTDAGSLASPVFAAEGQCDLADDSGEKRQQRLMGRVRRRFRGEVGDDSEVWVIRRGGVHDQAPLDEWLIRSVGRFAAVERCAVRDESTAEAIHPLLTAMRSAPTGWVGRLAPVVAIPRKAPKT